MFLHTRTKTILVGGFILGSKNSRSALVLAKKEAANGEISVTLAEIQYFASCNVVSADNGHTEIVWIACIKWFMEHQCRVWFGQPTQVWSSACYPGNFFIPITDIVSRVVYSHHLVNFGRFIGEEKVYIITPFEILNYS